MNWPNARTACKFMTVSRLIVRGVRKNVLLYCRAVDRGQNPDSVAAQYFMEAERMNDATRGRQHALRVRCDFEYISQLKRFENTPTTCIPQNLCLAMVTRALRHIPPCTMLCLYAMPFCQKPFLPLVC